MANLDWGTVNRCAAYGLTGGMGSLGNLGAGSWAQQVAISQASADAQQKIKSALPRLDQAYNQLQQVYSQAQQVYSQAQDLAAQSANASVLNSLDRVSSAISQVEDLMANVEAQYDAATRLPSRPYVPGESDAGAVQRRQDWLDALPKVEKATETVRAAAATAQRQIVQATAVLKQIQQQVQREVSQQQAEAAREAQRQALEEARFAQQQQLEQARLNQQFAMEQARAQQELALQQAQLQSQYALLQPPAMPSVPSYTAPAATAYTPPGVPAGFAYDPSTGYYYNPSSGQYYNAADGRYYVAQGSQQAAAPSGVQYNAAAVQYAQQPASWSYQQPSQWIQPQGFQTPQAQTGQELFDPNWTNVEYQDLIAGEAQYLFRGLRGLGAVTIPGANLDIQRRFADVVTKGKPTQTAADKAAVQAALIRQAKESQSPITTSDFTAIIDALGVAAGKALPSFFPGMAQEQPPPELPPRSSGLGTAAKVGLGVAGGAALLYGLSKIGGGSTSSRRRRR